MLASSCAASMSRRTSSSTTAASWPAGAPATATPAVPWPAVPTVPPTRSEIDELREQNATLAAELADVVIATSDNPRTEDPQAIIEDIVSGMSSGAGRFEVEADRRAAIARAIAQAKPGDSILIAGKGHEDYQLVGDQVLSFDDRIVAAEELARAFGDEPAGEDR